MTSRSQSFLSVYASVVAIVLAFVFVLHNDAESRASRLDLKVMTLELKGQSAVIDRMGVLRNETRKKAEVLETSALFLAIALALVAPAMVASGVAAIMLTGMSIGSSLIAISFPFFWFF